MWVKDMDWNQFFLQKDDWQKNTFNRIKNDLICVKNNRFVNYDNSEKNYLVMMYGKSQVGKTTLILNMIGLKSEYFQEVYDTLRAGVPRGNSSTSTAIIYSKSNNNQYGCSFSLINDLLSKNVEYFDKSGMVKHLEKIRNNVENNRINLDRILFLYIPNNYFINDSSVNNISIMDMPGVESRNHKEDNHVHNIMSKYIPISSVCIITCTSNEIQSLETTELPNGIKWKDNPHKFILVITKSYNDGNTKIYFKDNHSRRKMSFYDFVKKVYNDEIKKILGNNNQIEVYPVDVGDTLNNLYLNEIKDKADKAEIIITKDRMLSDLRQSIITRKGEKLKSALKDLEIIADYYRKEEKEVINKEIKDNKVQIENKKKSIIKLKKYIEILGDDDSEKSELKNELNDLTPIKYSVDNYHSHNKIRNLYSFVDKYIRDNKLYKNDSNGEYIKDKDKQIFSYLCDYISLNVERFVDELLPLIKKAGINIALNKTQIINQAYSDCIYIEKYNLYPRKSSFFSKNPKVYMKDVEHICSIILEGVNQILKNKTDLCIDEVNNKYHENGRRIQEIDYSISKENCKIERYEKDINSLYSEINILEGEASKIDKDRNDDIKNLEMYMEYAKNVYTEQRNKVISQIKNSVAAEDKMMLILFLGLLDEDYHTVIGGINETS